MSEFADHTCQDFLAMHSGLKDSEFVEWVALLCFATHEYDGESATSVDNQGIRKVYIGVNEESVRFGNFTVTRAKSLRLCTQVSKVANLSSGLLCFALRRTSTMESLPHLWTTRAFGKVYIGVNEESVHVPRVCGFALRSQR